MVLYLDLFSALGGTRIPNLLIRSQMLCPIELRAQREGATLLDLLGSAPASGSADRPRADSECNPRPVRPESNQPSGLSGSTVGSL